jgi:signal transduction histidine kinase
MKKVKILVVEDEGIIAMSIQSTLKNLGYTVLSLAVTGKDAVKKAGDDKLDLVLMDISLRGEMDGIEAAGHIRSKFNIPVVYLTAHSDEKMLMRAKVTEPFGYIVKPFDDRDLRIAVEMALHKHRIEDEMKMRLEGLVEERTKELKETYKRLNDEIKEKLNYRAEAFRAAELASIGELAAGVAHEINNPINGIINGAQILINNMAPESNEHKIASMVMKEGDRIANIVRSLLSFARINENEKRLIQAYELIVETMALTEAQLKKDGIKVKINVPTDLPLLNVCFQQLQQVIINIINNARYALNEKYPDACKKNFLSITGKRITVEDKSMVRFTFFDSGVGIPYDELNKVINPFFTTKPVNKGTGLGLSISHGIISDHGGSLQIDSVYGKFTKVTVDLPVK